MTPKPSRILLVDDDAATRTGLVELLAGAGYEIQAVATFEEGLRVLRTGTPDLLIADVRLGAFNGLQLLVSSPRSVPAIIITGFADPVLESDARQHGAEYVLKPVTPSILLEMIQRRLAQIAQSTFETLRRFERKTIPDGLPARIDDLDARILDVSYGGLRFRMPRVGELPASLTVRFPASELSVRTELIWHSPIGDDTWLCGAAVPQTNLAAAREWRGLVDSL